MLLLHLCSVDLAHLTIGRNRVDLAPDLAPDLVPGKDPDTVQDTVQDTVPECSGAAQPRRAQTPQQASEQRLQRSWPRRALLPVL